MLKNNPDIFLFLFKLQLLVLGEGKKKFSNYVGDHEYINERNKKYLQVLGTIVPE